MKGTTDHEEIKQWIITHHGKPAVIDHSEAEADKKGIRVDFPGDTDEALLSETEDTTWNTFFTIFDEEQLRFIYDPEAKGEDKTEWYWFEPRNG